MKKAFPFKKRLSAVLAAVLAVAAAAGTTPASAQDKTYAYSTIGSYGSFEEYMWRLSDNTSGDILSFNAENQPVVTKGTGATGTEGTSLASRRIVLAAGNYQLSFAVKASSQAYYIVSGYGFDSAGSPKEIMYGKTYEGSIATEWTTVTADFTVPEGYTSNEFRIFLRGNSGEQITVKDLDVKAIEEKVILKETATWEGWQDSGYNNPQEENCQLLLEENGAGNKGALHFYQPVNPGGAKNVAVSQKLIGLETNKTYVFTAKFKGYTNGTTDLAKLEMRGGYNNLKFEDSNDYYLNLDLKSDDWQDITYSFSTTTNTVINFSIKTGGFSIADFYFDDIKIYAKDDESKTNLIANGDFCKTEAVKTLDKWQEDGYNDPQEADCRLLLEEDGAGVGNKGALHFYQPKNPGGAKNIAVSQRLIGLETNKTYVFTAKFKGYTNGTTDLAKLEMRGGYNNLKFEDSNDYYLNLDLKSDDWQDITYSFSTTTNTVINFSIKTGGFSIADFYFDDIKIYAKDDESKTNLIANGDFCEKEAVISDSSAIDNSPYAVQNVPGFDIGMLNNEKLEGNKELSVVPGGSYDGSTAVQFKVVHTGSDDDKAERYFQQLDGVKFVLGDTSIKATGYFKVTEGNTEPKIWLGFGKKYNGKDSVGLHFAEYLSGKQTNGESFTDKGDGWYYFEKTVDPTTFDNKIDSVEDLVWVKYMCGIDARKNAGTALFDNVTCEIVSSAKPGDTNNDGDIDIRDLVHMKKYAAGAVKFTDMTRGTWLSDIGYNESPSITNEMVCMRKYLIGVSSEYGK